MSRSKSPKAAAAPSAPTPTPTPTVPDKPNTKPAPAKISTASLFEAWQNDYEEGQPDASDEAVLAKLVKRFVRTNKETIQGVHIKEHTFTTEDDAEKAFRLIKEPLDCAREECSKGPHGYNQYFITGKRVKAELAMSRKQE
jgi:hypothetical protein